MEMGDDDGAGAVVGDEVGAVAFRPRTMTGSRVYVAGVARIDKFRSPPTGKVCRPRKRAVGIGATRNDSRSKRQTRARNGPKAPNFGGKIATLGVGWSYEQRADDSRLVRRRPMQDCRYSAA